MSFNIDSEDVRCTIEEAITSIKEKNPILKSNQIIRDDIFTALENEATVVYYPLEEEKNQGFHVEKHIKNREVQFVYINTNYPLTIQVFTAAHELGHIHQVTRDVIQKNGYEPLSRDDEEKIVNRFAASILMPKDNFVLITKKWINENDVTDQVSVGKMINLIVYLMNAFLVPYQAVVRRMNEVQILHDDAKSYLLKLENDISDIIEMIIEQEKYTRLLAATKKKYISGSDEVFLCNRKKSRDNPLLLKLETMFRPPNDIENQIDDKVRKIQNDRESIEINFMKEKI